MKLVAGNWKMNGLAASEKVIDELLQGLAGQSRLPEILICPPATLLVLFARKLKGTPILVGGQTCHPNPSGAHTGDISAEMLKDAGASHVIVGHSERRTDHKETDEEVLRQSVAVRRVGLSPIICVGENESAYAAGQTKAILSGQLKGSIANRTDEQALIIAYEPIWAIGTGRTPTIQEIVDTHGFIRQFVAAAFGNYPKGLRILYGGSVKPSNAREILNAEGVDGVLVGGASLKSTDFLPIIAGCKLD